MTLTIELTPEQEAQLANAARRKGVEPAELVRELVVEHLPSISHAQEEQDPTIALLQSWLDEDATDDPEEIRRAQEELDAFKQALNAERERAGARRIYP